MISISSYKFNTFTVNNEKQYQWALKFCYIAECSLVICLLAINAWKHVYLTILIVLVLNTQKHLVVTSDFCMFHGKIIEGWHNFSLVLLAKLWLNLFFRKKIAKSTSCFQNNKMKTCGVTNTISRRLHDSHCENINSKLKMKFFFLWEMFDKRTRSRRCCLSWCRIYGNDTFYFRQATMVPGRNILIQDKNRIIYEECSLRWGKKQRLQETNIDKDLV